MTRTRTVPRGLRPLSLALIVAVLCIAAPGTAAAAGWLAVTPVAPAPADGALVIQPRIASDADGDQVAVWIEDPAVGAFRVMASVRTAGGTWGAAQTLGNVATGQPSVDLAADASGNFIVVFTELTGSHAVRSAYLPAGATTFEAPQPLQTGSTPALSSPAVAFDGQGRAFATFLVAGNGPQAYVRNAGSGVAWAAISGGLPVTASSTADLAVAPDGEATLVEVAGGNIRYSRRGAGGGNWGALNATGTASGTPIIVADGQGRTTAVYTYPGTFTGVGYQTCSAGTGGACSGRATFTQINGATSVSAPALAVDANSNAVAAWTECASANCNGNIAITRRTGFNAPWSAPVQVGPGNTPAVTIGATGAGTSLVKDTNDRMSFSLAPSGSPFPGALGTLGDPARFEPRLTTDAAGNVFAIWRGAAVETAIYDAQPPLVQSVTAPVTAVAGAESVFQVAASDPWSPVTFSWEFGDGGTATGPAATHTYSAPGAYTARVVATDAVGNQSSQTQVVTVAPAPLVAGSGAGLPRPVAGATLNVDRVRGTILVRVPGSKVFVPLTRPTQVQHGSIIDARKGRVRITIDNGVGGLDTADFFGGVFRFTQPAVRTGVRRFANLHLVGGNFRGCPAAPRKPRIAGAAGKARKKSSSRSVRQLWGDGHGSFRTVGRFSSATIRGTKWLTNDTCNGTLTKVTVGKVGVRDFVRRRTIVVKAGRQYLASARATASRRARR